MGELIAGSIASVAGSMAGNAMMGNQTNGNADYVNNMVQSINGLLGNALQQAIGSSTANTNSAISTQNSSLNSSINALNTGLTNALNQSQTASNTGLNESLGLNAPYSQAGYNALDKQEALLGVAGPQGGNANLANSLFATAQLGTPIQQMMQAAQAAGVSPYSTPTAPTASAAPTLSQFNPNNAQLQQEFLQYAPMVNGHQKYTGPGSIGAGMELKKAMQNPNIVAALQQQYAQPAYQAALTQYQQQQQQQQSLFNNYNNAYNNLNTQLQGISPNQLNTALSYNQGLFTK